MGLGKYLGLLYYTNEYEGELKSSVEGEVMWINYFKDKNRYHLSEGLEELIDLILSNKWAINNNKERNWIYISINDFCYATIINTIINCDNI